ncbi:MAG: adenylosuccinate synthase [Methylotenera sp.]|nr:MAG: adenylosuccinate synthase [Methylotenera sp.]
MIRAAAVIGAGYGDEGKGLMTDFLTVGLSRKQSIVIRYNGGAQAGHTVQLADGRRHIFSHFGSGSFNNVPTMLSEHFVVHPHLFRKERNELVNKFVDPEVFVHPDCMVTTPFDMMTNRIIENRRGANRHGSVGVGFGETFDRDDYMKIRASDLLNLDTLREKLILVRDRWVPARVQESQNEIEDEWFAVLNNPLLIENFLEECQYFNRYTTIVRYDGLKVSNIIFEGAQGLMLDQTYGFFPHVTRSNTGLKNIVDLCKHFDIDELTPYYMSRSYTTRHGAGPLANETEFPDYVIDNTNHAHEYQGSLRYAPLNLQDTLNAIDHDLKMYGKDVPFEINEQMCFTCMDQLPEKTALYYMENELVEDPVDTFEKLLTSMSIHTSYGPTRDHIQVL